MTLPADRAVPGGPADLGHRSWGAEGWLFPHASSIRGLGRNESTTGGVRGAHPTNAPNAAQYLDEEVANAPETIGDTGLLLAQPVVVRNAHVVHIFEERVFSGEDQIVQAFGAGLLHAFQTESDVDRDFL